MADSKVEDELNSQHIQELLLVMVFIIVAESKLIYLLWR